MMSPFDFPEPDAVPRGKSPRGSGRRWLVVAGVNAAVACAAGGAMITYLAVRPVPTPRPPAMKATEKPSPKVWLPAIVPAPLDAVPPVPRATPRPQTWNQRAKQRMNAFLDAAEAYRELVRRMPGPSVREASISASRVINAAIETPPYLPETLLDHPEYASTRGAFNRIMEMVFRDMDVLDVTGSTRGLAGGSLPIESLRLQVNRLPDE